MVKVRFREASVKDGDEIEVPKCTALSIHLDPLGDLDYVVTWLEEVKE